MKRWVLIVVGASVLLSGCATHYDLTLTSGNRIRARTKPKLNEYGFFVFEDLSGQERAIAAGRVRVVEAVRAGSEQESEFLDIMPTPR